MKLNGFALILFFIILNVFSTVNVRAENIYESQNQNNLYVKNIFSEYMKNVRDKLQFNWYPPDFMEDGQVRILFKLDRQGRIVQSSIIESSGNDIYDESALEALSKSAPFGEFPDSTTKEFISIKYLFNTVLIEDERMNGYYELAKLNYKNNPQLALQYLNMAIDKVGGIEDSSFLYKKRAKLKENLGDSVGAQKDYEIYSMYTNHTNIRRVHLLKHLASVKPSVYIYHYLAYAYELIGDYDEALNAINKAIELDAFNMNLKNYKKHLLKTANNSILY